MMKARINNIAKKIVTVLGLIVLSACSSLNDPTVSYFIFDLPNVEKQTSKSTITVSIEDVKLLAHLNTTSMVQQISEQQIASSNWHLWALPPAKMLTQATITNLQNNLDDLRITSSRDLTSQQQQIKVRIYLNQFNGGLQNNALVSGRWQILSKDNQLLQEQSFHQSNQLTADGFAALAQALQQGYTTVLADLSRQIIKHTSTKNEH